MLKSLVIILLMGLVASSGFAQAPTDKQGYSPKVFSFGNLFNQLRADSALHIPHKYVLAQNTTDSTPQLFVWSTPSGDSLVLFVNGRYIIVGSGTGSGTVTGVAISNDSLYYSTSSGNIFVALLLTQPDSTTKYVTPTQLAAGLAPKLSAVSTANSVAGNGTSGSPIQLAGDALSPGASKYYGTDGSGTKGYNSLPTGVAPANPTASIGATPINGVAVTYMRSDAAPGIGANAVTNALLAQAAALTMKGNNAGITGNEVDLTVAQINAMIGLDTTLGHLNALATLYRLYKTIDSLGGLIDTTILQNTGTVPAIYFKTPDTLVGKGFEATAELMPYTNADSSISDTLQLNSVLNSKLAKMAANTIKGNNTGSSAAPADLTISQLDAMIGAFTTSVNGLVPTPASALGATYFLNAAGGWTVPAGGGSSAITGTSGGSQSSPFTFAVASSETPTALTIPGSSSTFTFTYNQSLVYGDKSRYANFYLFWGPFTGNTSGSGTHNADFAIQGMQNFTSGSYNTGIGFQALYACTTCSENFAGGEVNLFSCTTCSQNSTGAGNYVRGYRWQR